MGLKNYIKDNIYVCIDDMRYVKNNKFFSYFIHVFMDQEKKNHLFSKEIKTTARHYYPRVLGFEQDPPVNPTVGDTYYSKAQATGAWKGRDLALAKYTEQGWHVWNDAIDGIVYYKPLESFCRLDKERQEIVKANPEHIRDIEWWNSMFAPEVVFGSSTLYRQAYLFLKQLPGFENAVDC